MDIPAPHPANPGRNPWCSMSSPPSAPAAARPQPQPPAHDLRLVIGSIAVLLLLASLDQTIVSTALPTIVADLGGLEHLSWVVTAYILTATIVAPLYGKLGDLYGRRNMVFLSVGLFLGGSALCGLSMNMAFLIAARALRRRQASRAAACRAPGAPQARDEVLTSATWRGRARQRRRAAAGGNLRVAGRDQVASGAVSCSSGSTSTSPARPSTLASKSRSISASLTVTWVSAPSPSLCSRSRK